MFPLKLLLFVWLHTFEIGLQNVEAERRAIIGGEKASEKRPFFVRVFRPRSGRICGGTIINSEWILTARHCVQDEATTSEENIQLDPACCTVYEKEWTNKTAPIRTLGARTVIAFRTSLEIDGISRINGHDFKIDLALIRVFGKFNKEKILRPCSENDTSYTDYLPFVGMGSKGLTYTCNNTFVNYSVYSVCPVEQRIETGSGVAVLQEIRMEEKMRFGGKVKNEIYAVTYGPDNIDGQNGPCYGDSGSALFMTERDGKSARCLYGFLRQGLPWWSWPDQEVKEFNNSCAGTTLFERVSYYWDEIQHEIEKAENGPNLKCPYFKFDQIHLVSLTKCFYSVGLRFSSKGYDEIQELCRERGSQLWKPTSREEMALVNQHLNRDLFFMGYDQKKVWMGYKMTYPSELPTSAGKRRDIMKNWFRSTEDNIMRAPAELWAEKEPRSKPESNKFCSKMKEGFAYTNNCTDEREMFVLCEIGICSEGYVNVPGTSTAKCFKLVGETADVGEALKMCTDSNGKLVEPTTYSEHMGLHSMSSHAFWLGFLETSRIFNPKLFGSKSGQNPVAMADEDFWQWSQDLGHLDSRCLVQRNKKGYDVPCYPDTNKSHPINVICEYQPKKFPYERDDGLVLPI